MLVRSMVLLTACLVVGSGCTSLPTVKQVADHLETVELGTRLTVIRSVAPDIVRVSAYSVPQDVRNRLDVWLTLDPSKRESSTFYRQWPHGAILTLDRGDLALPLDVRDAIHTGGSLDLLLTPDLRYKGYLAVSRRSYSRDDALRATQERAIYLKLGLQRLVTGAQRRLESRLRGGDDWSHHLPPLPLSRQLE